MSMWYRVMPRFRPLGPGGACPTTLQYFCRDSAVNKGDRGPRRACLFALVAQENLDAIRSQKAGQWSRSLGSRAAEESGPQLGEHDEGYSSTGLL
jgi:hypothetical protein